MSQGGRTSDFYRTKNLPERFDNPGKPNFKANSLITKKKTKIFWHIVYFKLIDFFF